jgi:hypothetical protein
MALVGWRWGGVVKRGGTKGKGGRTKRAVGLARAAHLLYRGNCFNRLMMIIITESCLDTLKTVAAAHPHAHHHMASTTRVVAVAVERRKEEEMIQKGAKEKAKLGKEKGCMKRIDRGCGRIPNQIC